MLTRQELSVLGGCAGGGLLQFNSPEPVCLPASDRLLATATLLPLGVLTSPGKVRVRRAPAGCRTRESIAGKKVACSQTRADLPVPVKRH